MLPRKNYDNQTQIFDNSITTPDKSSTRGRSTLHRQANDITGNGDFKAVYRTSNANISDRGEGGIALGPPRARRYRLNVKTSKIFDLVTDVFEIRCDAVEQLLSD